MGAGGSIQNMINSYNDNMNMRRKKSLFSRGRIFDSEVDPNFKNSNLTLGTRKLTESELKKFRDQAVKKRNQDKRIRLVLFFVVLAPSIFGLIKILQTTKINNRYVVAQDNKSIPRDDLDRFKFYLTDADNWAENQKWDNAIYQYKNALQIIPDDYLANYRLARTYLFSCKTSNQNCRIAINFLNSLIKQFPDKAGLYQLRAEYFLYNNLPDLAGKDFEKINQLNNVILNNEP